MLKASWEKRKKKKGYLGLAESLGSHWAPVQVLALLGQPQCRQQMANSQSMSLPSVNSIITLVMGEFAPGKESEEPHPQQLLGEAGRLESR